MASIPSSSSSLPSTSPSQPKARKKLGPNTPPPPPQTKWRSGTQERLYSHRLVDALRATRDRAPPQESIASRAVKEAADSALALTARGQSRWSRAILLNRNSCRRRVLVKAGGKIRRHKRKHQLVLPHAMVSSGNKSSERGELKERTVKERLKKLGRIVPGCRKLPAATLLEEAADYVAALELQVRTMRALAEALSAAAVSLPEEEEATAEPMEIAEH